MGFSVRKKRGGADRTPQYDPWVPYPTNAGAGPSAQSGNVVPSGRKGGGRGGYFIQWFHGTARTQIGQTRNEEQGGERGRGEEEGGKGGKLKGGGAQTDN